MPTSSQLRNALAYMSITVLVLVFLNIYSARATRDLMFKAKCSSSQDKLKVVTSSFSGVDALTQETTEQIISVIGDMNVTRLLVTDAAGRTLYDSVPGQSAAGSWLALPNLPCPRPTRAACPRFRTRSRLFRPAPRYSTASSTSS